MTPVEKERYLPPLFPHCHVDKVGHERNLLPHLGRGKVMCDEMIKLRDYLTEHKIEWVDDSESHDLWWMDRTKFTYNGHSYSVINGCGSYGGCYLANETNRGLLECMIDMDEPVGYLKADDVIDMLKQTEKTEKCVRQIIADFGEVIKNAIGAISVVVTGIKMSLGRKREK